MKYMKLATVLSVVMASMLLALAHTGSANAATSLLHPIIPGGVSSQNSAQATAVVMQRAAFDPNLAAHMATETGASTFIASDYVSAGYQTGAPGTVNAGESYSGVVVATGDTPECNAHSWMLRIMNKATGKVVLFCTACGNIRLHVNHRVELHKFVKSAVLRFRWRVNQVFNKTCPGTGQAIAVKVNVLVKGLVRVKTWAKAVQLVEERIQVMTNHQISIKVGITCSKPPVVPPPPPPVTVFNATASATATASAVCPDGTTATATGYGFGSATSTISQQDADSKAQAQADAYAQANASANIKCGTGGPPPCTPTVTMTTINDLDAGGWSPNFEVTVSMCGGDTGTMHVSAQFGSMSPATPTTVSGLNTYTFTYYAPSEVPPGGQDWVTVMVQDNQTGASVTQSTPNFNINPPPPSS